MSLPVLSSLGCGWPLPPAFLSRHRTSLHGQPGGPPARSRASRSLPASGADRLHSIVTVLHPARPRAAPHAQHGTPVSNASHLATRRRGPSHIVVTEPLSSSGNRPHPARPPRSPPRNPTVHAAGPWRAGNGAAPARGTCHPRVAHAPHRGGARVDQEPARRCVRGAGRFACTVPLNGSRRYPGSD